MNSFHSECDIDPSSSNERIIDNALSANEVDDDSENESDTATKIVNAEGEISKNEEYENELEDSPLKEIYSEQTFTSFEVL
ncbi:17216_t:CDS:2, partial [Racocetra fulgida]